MSTEQSSLISRVGKTWMAGYLAWLDEGGVDRTIIGGMLLILLSVNVVLLDETFTDAELDPLFVDLPVVGDVSVFVLALAMVLWYMIRPLKVSSQIDPKKEEIDNVLNDETDGQ
jgi:hypothetical protein